MRAETRMELATGTPPAEGNGVAMQSSPNVVRGTSGQPRQVVTELLREMRLRWAGNQKSPAEEFIAALPTDFDSDQIVDLIYSEFLLRQQYGVPASEEAFIQRFPQYANALKRQFSLDAMLGPTQPDLSGTTLDAAEPTEHPLLAGKAFPISFGKYVLVAPLDRGGQAEVLFALHPLLRKEVVVKLSRQSIEQASVDSDRLLEEGRILAQLNHPSLAAVHDLDIFQGYPFAVIEYVRGKSLDQVHKENALTPQESAALVAQVARAVSHAHRENVVHLDIKPKNILVEANGRPRLIDFGLACLQNAWNHTANSEQVAGTPQFMAPEQARMGAVGIGPAADVYSLGGVLYFLLTQQVPHDRLSMADILLQISNNQWDRDRLQFCDAPVALKRICTKALATDPADRHASADDLAHELEAVANVASRRSFLLAGSLALLGLAGSGALTAGFWQTPLDDPRLEVRVWNDERFGPFGELPLQHGDRLQIRGDLPANCSAALFLFDSEGRWSLIQEWTRADEKRTIVYPALGQSVPVVGRSGTDLFLLCITPRTPLPVTELQEVFEEGEPLRHISPYTLAQVDGTGVRLDHAGRGIGKPMAQDDPTGFVEQRLANLAKALDRKSVKYFGVAFFHK